MNKPLTRRKIANLRSEFAVLVRLLGTANPDGKKRLKERMLEISKILSDESVTGVTKGPSL